jgi:hypothetical protein
MLIYALFVTLSRAFRLASSKKPAPIRHYFNTTAPAGHIPDESEIPYWEVQLPEHY